VALAANPAQRLYEEKASRRNIVLQARQMGVSTWIAGILFANYHASRNGHVQVAHNQERLRADLPHRARFLALLPESLCAGG